MSRIAYWTLFVGLTLGLSLGFENGLANCFAKQAVSTKSRKPNIILIMADDVSWEAFGCYGGEDYKTPVLDGLAKQGMRFNHCYSTPICTTSRVKIMTGQYNFRNYTHFGYLPTGQKTFGNLLKSAGYRTAIAGKWQLNGLKNKMPGYKDPSRPIEFGFDEYMLWQLTTTKQKNGPGGERFWSPPYEHNGKFLTREMNEGKYGPDMLCEFVCDFMERNQDQPFFVYYPMVLVHDPFVPTPDTIGERTRGHSSNTQPKNKAKQKENFVAMVNYTDKIVGRIVDKVRQINQLENTIILFTADNGTNPRITSRWKGQDIKGGKGGMKDMGTHVPLIAYWKGHTPNGRASNDLIEFTDFYATFAEAAGINLGKEDPIDSKSFLPQLKGETGQPRKWVFCHYEPYWNKKPGQFVRNGQYKLYRDGRFFNVPQDLKEEMNLVESQDPNVQSIRQTMQKFLDRCPPAPTGPKAGPNTVDRPIFPAWKNLFDLD